MLKSLQLVRPICYSFTAALLLPALSSAQAPARSFACTPAALDHVPIAVHSLDQARLTYEALGFRLKPGRVHANGLRNAFAKLPGGDYLELIWPERGAVDAQTERYVARLEAGEGGSSLALRVDSLPTLASHLDTAAMPVRLQRYGSAFMILGFSSAALHWLFLIEYLTPVDDPPELLAHPNTATSLETVWLTPHAFSALPEIADALCLPRVREAKNASGTAPVAGVTLRVRSLNATQQVLRTGGLDLPIHADPRGQTLRVPPDRAHGIWIEFLEPHSHRGS